MSSINGGWRGPNIVKDGLVLYLDAGSPNSFFSATAGTTWKDISGNNLRTTLTNGTVYSAVSGGAMLFDGVDDSVTVRTNASGSIFESQACTIDAWVRPLTLSGERTIWDWPFTSHNPPYYSQTLRFTSNAVFYATNIDGNYNGAQVNSGITLNNTHVVLTLDQFNRRADLYINGPRVGGSSYSTGSIRYYNTTIRVGLAGYGGPFNGNIYTVRYYNRALSASEVLQNFNATRARFGI